MSERIGQLVTEQRRLFLNVARKYAARGVEPEDCVQDATLLALRFAHKWRGHNLSAWFGTIVRNCALYSHRKNRGLLSLDSFDEQGAPLGNLIPDERATADEMVYRSQAVEVANRLSPIYREAIGLVILDGLTLKEASRKLHVPVGTLKARLSRGRKQLRRQMKLRRRMKA